MLLALTQDLEEQKQQKNQQEALLLPSTPGDEVEPKSKSNEETSAEQDT